MKSSMLSFAGFIVFACMSNFSNAANLLLQESAYLSELSYEGTLNKNGQFNIEVKFPLKSNVGPQKIIELMTEHETAIKASDSFVSTVTVNKASLTNKLVTSKIKIFYVYPDKVQVSCKEQGNSLEYKSECSMTSEAYMTNKFNYYKDTFFCTKEFCSIKSSADMAKGIFGVSENTLATVIAEKAIVRHAALGFIANNLPVLNTSDLILKNTKEFKKLTVFKNEIENLDESVEEKVENLSTGKCSLLKISYKNMKRSTVCI